MAQTITVQIKLLRTKEQTRTLSDMSKRIGCPFPSV